MNAQVVTVCHQRPTQPYYKYGTFLESLRRFAETPAVLGFGAPWRGLMTKAFLYRDWLRAKSNSSDRLILCDAWDVVFSQHPHGIGDRCAEIFGDAVVFNGEKACWPHGDLAPLYPDTGVWRFLNSGIMCGPADRILAMFDAMNLESIGVDRTEDGRRIEPNDQGEIQQFFTRQPPGVKMVVDGGCKLFQTLSACDIGEFDLSGDHIRNKITGTTPGVWHFNGGAKGHIMGVMHKKWDLDHN